MSERVAGRRRSPEIEGLLLMCLASSLFAVMTLAARMAARSATWATIGASRAFMGAVVAFIFAVHSGASLRTRSSGLSWARSGLGTVSTVATFYALSRSDLALGDAVTLLSTAPLFIALLAPRFLGERGDARLWVVLAIAFVGVILIAGPHLSLRALPAVSAIVAALTSAMAMMFLRKMRSGATAEPESTAAIALHFGLVAFVVLAIANLFAFRMPTREDSYYLALTGLSGGLAQLAMTRAYALTQAAKLGAMGYLGTVLSFIGSVVLLGERPQAGQLFGAVLVIGAGVALALAAQQKKKTEPAARASC